MNTVGETKQQRRSVHLLEHEEIYHKAYRDTVKICSKDTACADILRVYEVLSDQRATWLVEQYNIPDGVYPHEDDLWIDEQILLDLEWFTSWNRRHSTYARVIADVSPDRRRPSLIERKFLKTRYIARPYDKSWEPDPDELPTTLYHDERGYFLVVRNRNGVYIGNNGELCCARAQGFHCAIRQYHVEVDTVQAALSKSKSVWGEPPKPLQRYAPMVQTKGAQAKKEGTTGAQRTANPQARSSATANDEQEITLESGTTLPYRVMQSFDNKHNMPGLDLSSGIDESLVRTPNLTKQQYRPIELYRDTVDLATLCVAPWNPTTILGLVSTILAAPARPPDSDEEALQRWIVDWCEPAQRLYAATIALSPVLAWERIDRTTRYMSTPGSPSWWQRGPESGLDWRRTKTPVTLRNVADRYIFEYDDFMRQRQWWPSETTPYDGPPLEMIDEEHDNVPEPAVPPVITEVLRGVRTAEPTTDELPVPDNVVTKKRRRLEGLAVQDVEALADDILDSYPGLLIDYRAVAPGLWVVKVRHDDKQWFDLDERRWRRMTPAVERLIEEALLYAAVREGGGTSPPIESEETREYDAADV